MQEKPCCTSRRAASDASETLKPLTFINAFTATPSGSTPTPPWDASASTGAPALEPCSAPSHSCSPNEAAPTAAPIAATSALSTAKRTEGHSAPAATPTVPSHHSSSCPSSRHTL